MDKSNIFKSSEFYMAEGDILHILFKDEVGTPITIDLMGDETVVTTVPDAPTVEDATSIASTSFVANWYFNENTSGYRLDVAEDSAFTTFVAGYEDLDVANVDNYSIVGLTEGDTYYYRVRAYNEIGTSENSATTTVYIAFTFDDWFMPSKAELKEMYDELYLFGVGNFTDAHYFSSSEDSASYAWSLFFLTGQTNETTTKSSTTAFRPCRAFTSVSPTYSLRDIGPAGGRIFWKSGDDYLEAAVADLSGTWSNITAVAIGTTGTAIGTGQANTTAIIGQVGHTGSAAKQCDDLIA